ncbi:DUF1186 domain-containing protein [Pirellulales bacterium]|nr:DUF1186 domain-containing protein [Pirellulales bacterium]
MTNTETLQPTTSELLDSLRRFPSEVLPVGVLRELQQRGPSIQDELLRRLDNASGQAGAGVGSIPLECFYCLGLLTAHPCEKQLPTLERLLRLDHETLDELASTLLHDIPPILIREIARSRGPSDVLAWLDRLVGDDSIYPWHAGSVLSALPHLVRNNDIPTEQAVDRLVGLLRERADRQFDLLSTNALIELSNLGAPEFDAFVSECFDRGQIDTDYFCHSDWRRELDELTSRESVRDEPTETKFDFVSRLESWYCFTEFSSSFDPFDATFELSPSRRAERHASSLSAEEIDRHLQALRESNDENFPRAAVEALKSHVKYIEDQLIEEVSEGLRNAGGPDARSNNAPFLALALLIGGGARIPRDLLLNIVDLPEDQCMDLFGDAIHDAVALALSRSLRGDVEPIDDRIVDEDRPSIDRYSLVRVYPLSAWRGHLTRDEAIDRLFRLWQWASNDERAGTELVADGLLESLCVMSPQQHRDALLEAIDQVEGGGRFSPQRLRELIEDPSHGVDEVLAWAREYNDAMEIVEESVMFSIEAGHPARTSFSNTAPPQPSHDAATSTTTLQKATSTRRNDPCPCGSGKKYKKCCLRK